MKKLLACTAVVVAGAVLSGCAQEANTGDGQSGSTDRPRIAAFVLATANAYAQKNMEGVQDAADEAGADVDFFDGEFSGPTQLTQIQDAVATGQYDGFVVFPNDGAAVIPGVEDAAAAGIVSVAAYAPIGGSPDPKPVVEGVIGTVWHPNAENGTELGRLAVKACEEDHSDANPCTVAYISGGNAILFEQLKLEAFEAELAQADADVELVAQVEGNFLVADGRTASENLLQANPEIDVIASSGDQMTVGAGQALEDAGIKGVSLIGNGASEEGVAEIQAGRWFGSPVYLPIDEGYLAAKMLLDRLASGDAPEESVIDVLKATDNPTSITKENAADFNAQWSAAA